MAVIISGTRVLGDMCAVLLVWHQIKPAHTFILYLLNVCFNIILLSALLSRRPVPSSSVHLLSV